MKAIVAALIAISLLACDRSESLSTKTPEPVKPATPDVTLGLKYPKHFDSAWVMSSRWSGFMGTAIAIAGDKYYYWFYSDVNSGSETAYPYIGSFKIDGDVMELGFPKSLATGRVLVDVNSELYSYRWKMVRSEGSVRLHAEHDKPDDIARSLILDSHFNPNDPFRNQNALNP